MEPLPDAGTPAPLTGVEGARIILEGAGKQTETVTRSNGRFQFNNLAAGEYRLSLRKSSYTVVSGLPEVVKLAEGGCVELKIRAEPERGVHGTVYNAEGKPQNGIRVVLVPISILHAPYAAGVITTYSNADGRYSMKQMPAGEYYLGVNLDQPESSDSPYARIFYPDTRDENMARVIEIEDEGTVVEADLNLPPPEQERTLSGVVRWPDGRPAVHATLYLEDPRFPNAVNRVQATTEESGMFTIRCYQSASYRLHAVSACTQIADCRSADPVEIAPGVAPSLSLVLENPGHSGMQAYRNAVGTSAADAR